MGTEKERECAAFERWALTAPDVCECPMCGASWTIDDSDGEWHTPEPYCITCYVALPADEEIPQEPLVEDEQMADASEGEESTNDSHERWDAQGGSLSNADGSSPAGSPSHGCDDIDSDEDHLANACPAIDHVDNWAEWDDTVE